MERNDKVINRAAENRYKYVTIQIGWDVKLIAVQLEIEVYMSASLMGSDGL